MNDQKEEDMEHTVKSYRDLIAWQRARELVKETYLLTAEFPVGERFGLDSQMDRAAVSIPSSIAEGYGGRQRRTTCTSCALRVEAPTSWRRSSSLRKTSACVRKPRRRRLL